MTDVRIFLPNALSYKNKSLGELYKLYENAKIRQYQHRVVQTEKASFTPLVYNTYGGWRLSVLLSTANYLDLLQRKGRKLTMTFSAA